MNMSCCDLLCACKISQLYSYLDWKVNASKCDFNGVLGSEIPLSTGGGSRLWRGSGVQRPAGGGGSGGVRGGLAGGGGGGSGRGEGAGDISFQLPYTALSHGASP